VSVTVLVHHPKMRVRQGSRKHQYLRLDSYDFKARDRQESEIGQLKYFRDITSVHRMREYNESLALLERNIW